MGSFSPIILPPMPTCLMSNNTSRKNSLPGRMSGPFSHEETELILHGPFQASPLIVSLQPQQHSMPDKVRICRHLSKASKLHASMNSHIRKEDFPTCFDLASKVAEIVSFYPSVPSPPSFLLSFYLPLFAPCAWGCFLFFPLYAQRKFTFLMHHLEPFFMYLLRMLARGTHLMFLFPSGIS